MPEHAEPKVLPVPLGFVNAYIVLDEHPIIVDTGVPGSEDEILEALRDAGREPHSVRLILLTHGHADHFGSAHALKDATGASVAIHTRDAGALREGQNPPLAPTGWVGKLMEPLASLGQDPTALEPDIELEGHEPLSRFGTEADLIPTPGHTPGSLSLRLPSGEMIVGDLLARGLGKRTPNLPPFADDLDTLRESIERVLDLEPSRLYAGHGGPFDPAEVRERLL